MNKNQLIDSIVINKQAITLFNADVEGVEGEDLLNLVQNIRENAEQYGIVLTKEYAKADDFLAENFKNEIADMEESGEDFIIAKFKFADGNTGYFFLIGGIQSAEFQVIEENFPRRKEEVIGVYDSYEDAFYAAKVILEESDDDIVCTNDGNIVYENDKCHHEAFSDEQMEEESPEWLEECLANKVMEYGEMYSDIVGDIRVNIELK